jgi:hypothetical protein
VGASMRDFLKMRIEACTAAYFALSILLLLGTSVAHVSPLGDTGAGTTATGADADLFGSIAQHYLPRQTSGVSDANDANGAERDNVDGEPRGVAAGDESGNETYPAPGALAGGASTTGGHERIGPALASSRSHTSNPVAVLDSSFSSGIAPTSRATTELASDNALLTLGAGSRLFSSRIPASPMSGSSMNGAPGAVGVLTLLGSSFASTGSGRPPLPPYGRRLTWTFREPSTRPG